MRENYIQTNLFNEVFDGEDLTNLLFDRCNVHYCSFKNCIMNNVTFDRCNCICCDFEGVDKSKINFVKTNVIDEDIEERTRHHDVLNDDELNNLEPIDSNDVENK